jgi:hypothetical protein
MVENMLFEKMRIKKILPKYSFLPKDIKSAELTIFDKDDKVIGRYNWFGEYYFGENAVYFYNKKLLIFKDKSKLSDHVTWSIKAEDFRSNDTEMNICFYAPHDCYETYSKLTVKL